MTSDFLARVLLWSAAINYGLLVWWFIAFTFSHDLMFRLHGRWFKLSEEKFNAIHYAGMSLYKLAIVMLNLVPGLVLWWLGRAA